MKINAKILVAVLSVLVVFTTAAILVSKKNNNKKLKETSTSQSISKERNDNSVDAKKSVENRFNLDEFYDTTAISQAYLTGESSKLDDFDKAIFDKANEIINEIITDDMTVFEKELAVHDYLVYNCTYDEKALGIIKRYTDNSDNPYGALITRQSICSGYTTSFQMFMDMLEIPCKTVSGSNLSKDEHAWNMVEIEGNWYYVDVTWDDPVPDYEGRLVEHTYFNVLQSKMEEEHLWTVSQFPTTDSAEYTYINQTAKTVSNSSDIN